MGAAPTTSSRHCWKPRASRTFLNTSLLAMDQPLGREVFVAEDSLTLERAEYMYEPLVNQLCIYNVVIDQRDQLSNIVKWENLAKWQKNGYELILVKFKFGDLYQRMTCIGGTMHVDIPWRYTHTLWVLRITSCFIITGEN